jgi:hypothetical protein
MSLPEVIDAVKNWELLDERSQSPGFCRRSAKIILEVARKADESEPHVKTSIVVWPEPSVGDNVHYAVTATQGNQTVIFNSTPAAGFPIYHGPIQFAPGRLAKMVPSDDVI